MIRPVVFLLIGQLCTIALGAQDIWYTAAPNGLKFRETEAPDSRVLAVIPYGTALETSDIPNMPVLEYEGFQGNWLKFLYNGQWGFLFDGFLLPSLPPPKAGADIHGYMKELQVKTIADYGPQRKYTCYTNGIVHMQYIGDEYASDTWHIPQLHTLQQAFLFCRLLTWDNNLLTPSDHLPAASREDESRKFIIERPQGYPYLIEHIRVEGWMKSGEHCGLDLRRGEGEIIILYYHGH